ncbi:MAG: tetratricopeptide repeat protein [Acidobacteriaceae bacterium]
MKYPAAGLLTFFFAFLLAAPVCAQSFTRQSAQITGSVQSADGHGAENARVQLINPNTGSPVASAYTNSEGGFAFDNLRSGAYDLVADVGAAEVRQRIDAADIDVPVVLRLPRASSEVKGGASTVSVADYQIPKKARKAYEQAAALLAKNEEAAADKYIAEALTLYPNYSDALTLRGVRDLDQSKPNAAIDDLDNAVKADSSNARAYLVLASAFNATHRYDEALRILSRAASLAPNAWQGYYEMAKAHFGKSEFKLALSWLERAQEFAPKNFASLYLFKVNTLLALKNYAGAATELRAFLTIAPRDPQATQARAMLAQLTTEVSR